MSQLTEIQRIIYREREYPYIKFTNQDIADYEGLRDMYYGIGGFKNGAYIVPFPRESTGGVNEAGDQLPNFYQMRKELAHYENAFAPELDASVDPIYSKEQLREVVGSKVVDNFIMRPTGQNFTMSEYKRRHQLETKLYGTTWEVLDAPVNIPANASVETEQRFSPYSQFLNPLQVEGYALDDRGGFQMLVYFEDIDERNNLSGGITVTDGSTESMRTLRVWLKAEIDVLDTDGEKTGDTSIEFVTFTYSNDRVNQDSIKTFDTMPVMMWEDNSRSQSNLIAKSKYLNMVSMEKKRYNLESQVNDSYVKNCFAFLAVNQSVQQSIDLGNDGVMEYVGENVNKPEYVAPPVDHLESINEKINKLRVDLKEDMNSTIVLDSRASGDARVASDKRRLEKLKQDTKDVQDAETWLVNAALRNYVSGSWTYEVTYMADFESLTKIDTLDTIDNIIDSMGATEELKRQLVVDKIKIVYANDEKRMKELVNLQETGTVESTDTLPNDSFSIDEDVA